MKYQLRFPFRLATGFQISDDDEITIDDVKVRLHCEEPLYVLQAGEFSERADAERFLRRLWCGLNLYSLSHRVGIRVSTEIQQIAYAADSPATGNIGQRWGFSSPGIIHGCGHGDSPAIFPSDRRIAFVTGGDLKIIVTPTGALALGEISRGASLGSIDVAWAWEQLRTALELYSLASFETSSRAKFLTLWSALEVISPPLKLSAETLRILSDWELQLASLLSPAEFGKNQARRELESVRGSLRWLKDGSIGARVRGFAKRALEAAGRADATEMVSDIMKIYNHRNDAAHRGLDQFDRSLSDLEILTRHVLESCIENAHELKPGVEG